MDVLADKTIVIVYCSTDDTLHRINATWWKPIHASVTVNVYFALGAWLGKKIGYNFGCSERHGLSASSPPANYTQGYTFKTVVLLVAIILCHLYPRLTPADLKSPNLLVTQLFRVKVADFGQSRSVTRTQTMTHAVGTPIWSSPEVLKKNHYTEKADVYSFGIVMYARAFFFGHILFADVAKGGRSSLETYLTLISTNFKS